MDKNELIKITVTAVITIIARELVAFVLRHSKTAASVLKPAAIAIFNRHWMIIFVVVDAAIFSLFVYFIIAGFLMDDRPVTRPAIIMGAIVCIMLRQSVMDLVKSIANYFESLKKTRPPKK
jgi:hypothetical protein